ncbi:MAG TPA: hypothetical protein VGN81_23060 [Pseudonocardiaceae bacterium]
MKSLLLALAIGATTTLSGTGIAQASPLAPADPGQLVTLITGDQVLVRDGEYTTLPAAGSSLTSYQTANGDRYFVPPEAMPYLSHALDPALFDATTNAATSLRLTFAAGSTPTAPPGITLTSVSGNTAIGYASSGSAFTAALRAAIGADHVAGRAPGSTPPVPGLTDVAPADAAPNPVATPHFPLHVVQINVNDLTGNPLGSGEVGIVDLDNVHTVQSVVPIDDGLNKITLPAGHYVAIGLLQDFDADGNTTQVHNVVQQFTVPDTAGTTTTVTLEESAASARIGVTVPKPVTAQYEETDFLVTDPNGQSTLFGWGGASTVPLYVSPAPPLTVGTLDYTASWGGSSPDPKQNYRYDVSFGSANGIPADEHDIVTAGQISTVHDQIFADPAVRGAQNRFGSGGYDPAMAAYGPNGVAYRAPTPGDLTDYVASTKGDQWQQFSFDANLVLSRADVRTYLPGHDYSVEWGHGPIAPTLGRHAGPYNCYACVDGSTLTLAFDAFGDSDPSHTGAMLFNLPGAEHVTLYRDGTDVIDGNGYGAQLAVDPATPATYRAVLDVNETGNPKFSQSTATHTDLTVPYDPATLAGTVLPAMTLNYHLATDETNTSSAPVQVLNLRVGHVSYDGQGSRAPITTVSVQVSVDGGTTWQQAAVAGTAGNYVVLWPNKPGTSPSIRVTATDANGGSITQTVTNAYTVGSAS